MSFDLTISFDTATYLNPQLYMMVDTLKEHIPKDTILHINTNRPDDDKLLQWIQKQVPTKIYKRDTPKNLDSRCKYMLNCFNVDSDKDWIIKTEIDVLFLQSLKEFDKLLKDDCDIVIQSENRRIIQDDNIENRIWRRMYKAMNITCPNWKMQFVEGNDIGKPLLATGVLAVRKECLEPINRRWVPLTMICERWGRLGIHPNEFAFTGIILDEGFTFKMLPVRYNFNPIGHFRKGAFPSTELIDNCKVPNDTVVFDYHRWPWLAHVAKYNSDIQEIIDRNKKYIPNDVWNMSFEAFHEHSF